MEPTSERAHRALEDHRARTGFGPGRQAAVLERLQRSIANGDAESFAKQLDQERPASPADPGPAAGWRTRTGGVVALALAAGLAGLWFFSGRGVEQVEVERGQQASYAEQERATPQRSDPAKPQRMLVEEDPEVAGAGPTEVSPPPAVEKPSPKRPERVRPKPQEAAASPEPSTLAAEIGLLRRARAQLAAGKLPEALSALDRHAKRFEHGQLEPERAALRVEVLCKLDMKRGEKARARFLARYSESSHAKRVRELTCQAGG
jgi:hypothetical protein